MGAVPLKGMHTADGKQLLLFRSQTVSDASRENSSFSTLAATGHVKHFCECLVSVSVAIANCF
jgi:cytochrome b561